ncbi:hypothetical protein [Salinibacter ruber]|uniref:hypothetical protein n=1 Tax=Salinibacter ruber TaxID=146919 RepID=UPI00216959A8|nr:hypothetical protein [Salinibacter ruber]MCS3698615.1 hypothetical protein [Salinibacter ruber]
MLVAELTTTDLRKTRYQIESTGDISKPQQGYRIDTAGRETMRFSEEEVESISVVEEYLCGGVGSLRSRTVPVGLGSLRLAASDYKSQQ